MDRTSYTRLFAVCASTFLVLLGLIGFLEDPSFTESGIYGSLPGDYAVNGWANALHVLTGLLGLTMAARLSRPFSLIALVLFGGLGLWGILAPDGTLLAGILPATRPVNAINLAIGLLALTALVAAERPAIGRRLRWITGPGEKSRRRERARKLGARRRQRDRKTPTTRRSTPDG